MPDVTATDARKRGRPSDPTTDARVRQAFLRLLGERGFAATTMDDVARASGVSKPTLYARYGSKDALCTAVVRAVFARLDDASLDADPPREAVARILAGAVRIARSDARGSLLALLGWMSRDAALAATWRREVFVPRRAQVARALRRAIDARELDRRADVDLATDLLVGPVLFRALISGDVLDARAIRAIVDAAWRAFAPP